MGWEIPLASQWAEVEPVRGGCFEIDFAQLPSPQGKVVGEVFRAVSKKLPGWSVVLRKVELFVKDKNLGSLVGGSYLRHYFKLIDVTY